MNSNVPAANRTVSLTELASLFARIGLLSFGGGLTAWVHRETVVRRGWLQEQEFLSALILSQILPGSNVVNLTIYTGRRLRGRIGAFISVVALLAPPMTLVVVIAAMCADLMANAMAHRALEGVAAGAAGMTLSVGLRSLRAASGRRTWPMVLAAGIVCAIGILRLPLVPVALVAALVAFVLARQTKSNAS